MSANTAKLRALCAGKVTTVKPGYLPCQPVLSTAGSLFPSTDYTLKILGATCEDIPKHITSIKKDI